MFRRKEDGSEELISDSEGATLLTTPASGAVPATPVANPPIIQAAPVFRPAPPQAAMAAAGRPGATPSPAQAPSASGEAARPTPATPVNRGTAKRILTVGPEIQMKGEITSCDRVVIEGLVDATMRDVHTVELAESGALKGTAEVEDAEISGSFEGDLVVRGKLTIYASGRVRGNVTYGEIEIQRGGQISGNIRNAADAKAGANANAGKRAA
ncbi:MAG: polymer-forming cytoskeletal protein [Alphaproteobacteria bacterium]|nr:polymer-forming cytoskeletal protein [Alphaproteobacteria bacterium]